MHQTGSRTESLLEYKEELDSAPHRLCYQLDEDGSMNYTLRVKRLNNNTTTIVWLDGNISQEFEMKMKQVDLLISLLFFFRCMVKMI